MAIAYRREATGRVPFDGALGALTPKGSGGVATRRRTPGDVVGLSEQRSEDAHDAQEDDDPDDDDGDQKEDQEPKQPL